MPPARAKIRKAQVINVAQSLNFLPEFGHSAGIENLNLKPAHVSQHRATAQLHKNRQSRDFPEHHLRPTALKRQLILPITLFKMIVGQFKRLEPIHKLWRKHLAFAIECIATHPCAFSARQRQRAHMIQLFAQLALINQLCQADIT